MLYNGIKDNTLKLMSILLSKYILVTYYSYNVLNHIYLTKSLSFHELDINLTKNKYIFYVVTEVTKKLTFSKYVFCQN